MPVFPENPGDPGYAPPAQPTGVAASVADATALGHLDTTYLNRVQKDLRTIIPGDPTFLNHVGALLRAMIAHELANPDRIAADKAAADAQAKLASDKAAADLAARQEAEKAALPTTGPAVDKAAAELEAKHQAELKAADAQAKLAALAQQQAIDQKALADHYAEQRASLSA